VLAPRTTSATYRYHNLTRNHFSQAARSGSKYNRHERWVMARWRHWFCRLYGGMAVNNFYADCGFFTNLVINVYWLAIILIMHQVTLVLRSQLCLLSCVLGMTLNCIHIFIVTGTFLYWCVMRPASQRFFIHSCIYLRIFIISYLATFLGTNNLSVLMCRKAVNQLSIVVFWWVFVSLLFNITSALLGPLVLRTVGI